MNNQLFILFYVVTVIHNVYIGQTIQYFNKEQNSINNPAILQIYTKMKKTALADHNFLERHLSSFKDIKTLDREYNCRKRLITSEMININIDNHNLNKKVIFKNKFKKQNLRKYNRQT